jgi:uncharacterized protein YfiM (DUF2279 family)
LFKQFHKVIGRKILVSVILLFTTVIQLQGQSLDSTHQFNKKRFTLLATSSGVGYTGGMVGLGSIWYTDQLSNQFTFFNDNAEWMLMDKGGHFFSSFHVSAAAVRLLKWTGSSKKKSILFGGFAGLAMTLPVEFFDGFSKDYGASWGDALADLSGSVIVTSQYLLWDEIRIMPKFSYHETSYANMRPNTLGATPLQRFIKDYNGQTYWLSFNIASLAHLQQFPKWLNVSIGYSAKEMLYAMPNENNNNGYHSYAQGFLSLDIDFNRIHTKHAALRALFRGLNLLHMPLPALEYNGRNGFHFHPLYF